MKKLFFPLPSLFDLAVCGMMFLSFVKAQFAGFAFVFYTAFLMILSLSLPRKRSYRSPWLALVSYSALLGIFIHRSLDISPESFVNSYFNTMMLFEGFVYVLFGCLFIKTSYEYSTNLNVCFAALPIALIPIAIGHASHGRITPIVAFAISLVVYLFLKKRVLEAMCLLFIGFGSILLNFGWVAMKFRCRPYVFMELLREIKKHPFFGSGFNRTLSPDNMIIAKAENNTDWGWLYRHNDILSLGGFLGILAIVGIVGFSICSITQARVSFYGVVLWTILLTSLFQMTFFDANKAVVCLPLIVSCIVGTTNRRLYEV